MTEKSEFWCYEPKEIRYELLDPGIREVVRFLVSCGFNTCDSGDGESKRARGWTEDDGLIPFPHVFIEVDPTDLVLRCLDLVACLRGARIDVVSQTEAWAEVIDSEDDNAKPKPYIEATYDPLGRAVIGLYHVTSDMVPNDV